MKTLYTLKNVCFAYPGKFPALSGVDLEIQAPARVALVGPNGSGKSTLLKMLDGLCFPDSGSIHFEDMNLSEENFRDDDFSDRFRRRVGFLFQDPEAQLFSPTVWDEICFGPLQLRWDRKKIDDTVQNVLEQFGLTSLRDRPPHRLSVGEKKKVALASIIVLDPDVLLLDEPTAALDPRTQSVLLEMLHDWGARQKTIITSTHDLTTLREICDVVHVMQDGKIIHRAAPEELLANQPLLEEANLVHVHTHKHKDEEHAHPHSHDFHGHHHDSDPNHQH